MTKLISSESHQKAKEMHECSIKYLHSQMIPSSNKTKLDKIKILKRRWKLKSEGLLEDSINDEGEENEYDLDELEM